MKIAVVADIHGNVAALDAVLADIAARHVDRVVNLGDVCSGPLFPRETAERLMPLALPTVRGNHDRQVGEDLAGLGPSDRYAREALSPEQLAWLTGLPPVLRLDADVLMVHGTPGSDCTYFLETVTQAGTVRCAAMPEVEERWGATDAAVILCGHSHLSRLVRLDGGRLIVNPGSVGLPAYSDETPVPHVVESGAPHARYAILNGGNAGWSADFLAVTYDWEQAARRAEANGRADWAKALRTGRM